MSINIYFEYYFRIKNGPLTVFFNVHVDTHRIRVDAGDLFIVFAGLAFSF